MVALNTLLALCAISGTNQTVLLDFYSPSCGPCIQMEPTIRRLQTEGYPVQKVDVTKNPQLAARYGVSTVPSFIVQSQGRVIGRVNGATSYSRLRGMFDAAGYKLATDINRVRGQSPDTSQQKTSFSKLSPSKPRTAPPLLTKVSAKMEDATSLRQRAMQATVRLKVEDPTGYNFGTGTIIDVHGEEALILTCGHIFRDSAGKGKITVDLVAEGARGPVVGQLIAYDDSRRDIGLVAIRPGVKLEPAQVAPGSYRATSGNRVFSIGCDFGKAAKLVESEITSINRYVGPSNIEVRGRPAEGRSGGGLFSKEGYLIGVSHLADPTDNEGIYGGLEIIHEQLVQIKHDHIFRRAETALAAKEKETAAPQEFRQTSLAKVGNPPPMPKTMPRQSDWDSLKKSRASTPSDAVFAHGRATEIICIVRTKDNPRGRVIVLDRPSPELLDRIARESFGTDYPRSGTNFEASGRSAIAGTPLPRREFADPQPVVRGQSAD